MLNEGFAGAAVTMQQIEAGEAGHVPFAAAAPVLVAFVRAIGLKAGDAQRLSIGGPDDAIVADHTAKPLERDKAEALVFAGTRRPPSGWAPGPYRASYRVSRDGAVCWKAPSKPGSDGACVSAIVELSGAYRSWNRSSVGTVSKSNRQSHLRISKR